MEIEARLARLEAESAIRKLKAHYLNACDRKDPVAMRACYTKDAIINFPPLGEFDVDGLIEIFTNMSVNTNIIDSHLGNNPEITVDGSVAEAVWSLTYTMFNPDDQKFRILTGFYHDKYELADGKWLISYSRSEPRRIFDGELEETGISAQMIGA